jgi:hypothetical protein
MEAHVPLSLTATAPGAVGTKFSGVWGMVGAAARVGIGGDMGYGVMEQWREAPCRAHPQRMEGWNGMEG